MNKIVGLEADSLQGCRVVQLSVQLLPCGSLLMNVITGEAPEVVEAAAVEAAGKVWALTTIDFLIMQEVLLLDKS